MPFVVGTTGARGRAVWVGLVLHPADAVAGASYT